MRGIAIVLALAVAALVPARADALITRGGEQVQFTETADDLTFLSGGHVSISGKSSHDIFASGGRIEVNGAGADHLILAGGELTVSPGEVRSLIAFGGQIELRGGALANDLVAAGGEVTLGPEARINGSAVLAGGRLQIDAPIGGALQAAGGQIELNSAVGGPVTLAGRRITVGPNARIAGDLHVRGVNVEISPQAVVTGRTIREMIKPRAREAAESFTVLGIAFCLGMLVLPAVIAAAAPGLAQGANQQLGAHPLPTLGVGALIVLVGPVLIAVLFATLIGAPLALFLLLLLLAALAPAFAMIDYWIGQALRSRLARKQAGEAPRAAARFGWTLLGALVLALICMIPILGALVWLIALIAGIGALFSSGARATGASVPA